MRNQMRSLLPVVETAVCRAVPLHLLCLGMPCPRSEIIMSCETAFALYGEEQVVQAPQEAVEQQFDKPGAGALQHRPVFNMLYPRIPL